MVDAGVDFGPDRGARNVGASPGARHQVRGSWVLPRGETGGARKTGVPRTIVLLMYLTIIIILPA